MKLKVRSDLGEFVTIYNEANEEIIEFQSDEIDKLEGSICALLDYLNIEYEFNTVF